MPKQQSETSGERNRKSDSPRCSELLTLTERLERAISQRDHCLHGGPRQAHQQGEDIFWLMGWADNAIEVELLREAIKE